MANNDYISVLAIECRHLTSHKPDEGLNEVDDIDGCQEDCCPLDTEVEIKHETELVQLRD